MRAKPEDLPVTEDLWLGKGPEGPAARLTPSFGFYTYVIWNFAENVDGAKRFLADYIENCREAFLTSGFQNTPAFPGAVPDLATLVTNDAGPGAPGKYDLLADLATWTTNVGHPGYTNPAISEILQQGLSFRRCSPAPRPASSRPSRRSIRPTREVRRHLPELEGTWQGVKSGFQTA